MLSNKQMTHLLKRSMLRAAKLPLIYLITGIILITLATLDDFIPLSTWKTSLDLTDKIGNVFIALAILIFIYKLMVLLSRRSEKRLAEKNHIAAPILTGVRKGLRIIFFLIAINLIITLLEPSKVNLVLANNILNIFIITSVGWIAIQIIYTIEAVIHQNMMHVGQKKYSRAKALYTKAHIIRNIATVIIIFITIAAILMSFSSVRSIGISLLASAGFLTAIVGLAAQKTLFSLFSGLQIALAQPIEIGDIVVIEKVSGTIEEITFTYVILKLDDSRRRIIPINYFIEKSYENWSHKTESLKGHIILYVDYLMPIEPMRIEFNRILKNSTLWDKKTNQLQIANLTEQTVEVHLQLSANHVNKLSDLRAEVREKMLEFLRHHYPHYLPVLRINGGLASGASSGEINTTKQ